MISSVISRIRFDVSSILYGCLFSLVLFLLIGIWRVFDTNTFLFIQIVLTTLVLYVISLFLSPTRIISKLAGRELLSVLIAFTIVSTLLLNIDRSRSVFLVKWVYQYSKDAPVAIDEIISVKKLSVTEGISIKQRVDEQGQMSFIKKVDSGLEVTFIGRLFIQTSDLLSKILNLKGYKSA